MDFPVFTDTPYSIKMIVWLAMGAAALTVLFRNLKTWGILERLDREVTPDSGDSLKDKVNQAAKDSADTLDMVVAMGQRLDKAEKATKRAVSAARRASVKASAVKEDIQSIRSHVVTLTDNHDKINVAFARFVVHENNNTLNESALLAEEKMILEIEHKRKMTGDGSGEKQY